MAEFAEPKSSIYSHTIGLAVVIVLFNYMFISTFIAVNELLTFDVITAIYICLRVITIHRIVIEDDTVMLSNMLKSFIVSADEIGEDILPFLYPYYSIKIAGKFRLLYFWQPCLKCSNISEFQTFANILKDKGKDVKLYTPMSMLFR